MMHHLDLIPTNSGRDILRIPLKMSTVGGSKTDILKGVALSARTFPKSL